MPLTLLEFEKLTEAQRDTEILNAWLQAGGSSAMTASEKRYNETKSKPQRDAEIMAAILGIYTIPVAMSESDKRYFEVKTQAQRDTEIWNAIKEIT